MADTNVVDSGTFFIYGDIPGSSHTKSSLAFTVSVACGTTYTINAGSGTDDQVVQDSLSTTGWILRTYTATNPGCAVTTRQVSTTTGMQLTVSGLNDPVLDGLVYIAKPSA
jgi:hypothetical protein